MNPFSIGHKNCVHFFVYHTVNSLFFCSSICSFAGCRSSFAWNVAAVVVVVIKNCLRCCFGSLFLIHFISFHFDRQLSSGAVHFTTFKTYKFIQEWRNERKISPVNNKTLALHEMKDSLRFSSVRFGFWVFIFFWSNKKTWNTHIHCTQWETENNMENVSAVHEKKIIIKATSDTREKAKER